MATPGPSTKNVQQSPSTKPSNELANWKTYTNSQFGFSFQYPSSWNEDKELEKMSLTDPNVLVDFATTRDAFGNGVNMEIFNNPSSSIQSFIADHQKDTVYPNLTREPFVKNSSTLGIPGDWVIDRNAPGAVGGEYALIPSGKIVIGFYCTGCSDGLTDQILSTFKLIKN